MPKKIDSFRGDYRFLSNFWPSPIVYKKLEYPTVEHAYQAAKTNDPLVAEYIRQAATPGQAKRRGGAKGLPNLRPDWDDVRLEIMRKLVTLKFKSNPDLMDQLRATGNAELIEGNTWGDTYWGKCNGKGENHLGKILMEIRDEISVSNR